MLSFPRVCERLTKTYCAKRRRYGSEERCQPSSFIHEIPMQMYEYVDYEELMKAPATQEECDDFFADIHKMLREE